MDPITEDLILQSLVQAKMTLSNRAPSRDISEIGEDELIRGIILGNKLFKHQGKGPQGSYSLEYNLGRGPKVINGPIWDSTELIPMNTIVKFCVSWILKRGTWSQEASRIFVVPMS
jgi:hypothetical protein